MVSKYKLQFYHFVPILSHKKSTSLFNFNEVAAGIKHFFFATLRVAVK